MPVFKLTVTESSIPSDFLEDQADLIKVDGWDKVVFVRIPKGSTRESVMELDTVLKKHLGKTPYIVIQDSVQFCKLEEVK